jgi:hypothetical protein
MDRQGSDSGLCTVHAFMMLQVGLATIPFIVHPIDNAVHAVLNLTLRPAMKKYVCLAGQGKLAGLDMCAQCEEEQVCAIEESDFDTNGVGPRK